MGGQSIWTGGSTDEGRWLPSQQRAPHLQRPIPTPGRGRSGERRRGAGGTNLLNCGRIEDDLVSDIVHLQVASLPPSLLVQGGACQHLSAANPHSFSLAAVFPFFAPRNDSLLAVTTRILTIGSIVCMQAMQGRVSSCTPLRRNTQGVERGTKSMLQWLGSLIQ